MKKSIILGGLGIVVMGLVIAGASVYAYQGNPTKQGPNYTPERHEAMLKAFESKDYVSWKAQMGDRGVTHKINEQNFASFAQMHQLMLDGKTAEANVIRAELGLGQGGGHGKGMMGGQRGQNKSGNFVDANSDGICDRMQ